MNESTVEGAPEWPISDVILGTVELLSSVVGFVLNWLAVSYFYERKQYPTHFLYLAIVVTDIFTCLAVFPASLSLLYHRYPVILANTFFCTLAGFIFNITWRMSVFLISVLSVVRCVTISPTLPSPGINHAVAPVLLYLFIQVIQASLPFLFSQKSPPYYFSADQACCAWGIGDLWWSPRHSAANTAMVYILVLIPSFLPLFPVVISCAIFVKILVRSRQRMKKTQYRNLHTYSNSKSPTRRTTFQLEDSQQTAAKLKQPEEQRDAVVKQRRKSYADVTAQQATTTLCIVTAVYITFNVPLWIFYLSSMLLTDHATWLNGAHIRDINIFLSRTSVVMNAAANALVYFIRMRGVRQMLKGRIRNLVGWIRGRPPVEGQEITNYTPSTKAY